MKAILLAAGLGTRLGRLASERPKCLVEVGGKPVLQHAVDWAAVNGFSETAINLHYRAETVTAYFREHGSPLPIHWSYEPGLLGTAGTVRSLARWLGDEPFAVVYADNLIECNFAELHNTHARMGAAVTVALFEREDVSQSGVAEFDDSGRISRFVEKPLPGQTASSWVSAGLLLFEPEIAWLAPRSGDIGRDLLPALIAAGYVVAGYRMRPGERLHWIDTPSDLEQTRAEFERAAV